MMFGQQDTLPVTEKSTSHWRFGSWLSLATTADEDFLTGSPKQRWADLSDEDDDLFMFGRSPPAYRQAEVQDMAPDNTCGCTTDILETNKQYAGDAVLSKWSGPAPCGESNIFQKKQLAFMGSDAHCRCGQLGDGSTSRPMGCPRGAESTLRLPPKIQSHSLTSSCVSEMEQAESDASQHASSYSIFVVTLSGIPPKLCNDACLDAILWVAGVHNSALGSHSRKDGLVTLNCGSYAAATACCNHFKACAWATGKLKVDVLPGWQHTREDNVQPKKHLKGVAGVSHRPAKHTKSSFVSAQLN